MLKKEMVTRKKFNYLKNYYDKTWDPSGHTLHVGIFNSPKNTLVEAYQNATDYLISKINKLSAFNKNSVILDVGCGTGRTLIETCAKYNCRGVGIDISDEQIKDAKAYLADLNKVSKKKINCKFICGSASEIDAHIKGKEKFSHIISQDALLLIINKKRCFEGLYKLLKYNGIFAVTDFLSESEIKEKNEDRLVKKFVNWDKSLSFDDYIRILNETSFHMVHSELRNQDMIKTYQLLAEKMKPFIKTDNTYQDLCNRYNGIVKAIKKDQMGWGIFVAQKIRKQTLIAGTKRKSIGRFLATALHKMGWEIWLYSRSAKKIDRLYWHERKCDISSEQNIKKLLDEISDIELAMMLADTGGHGSLKELTENGIKKFVDAKLIGSLLLSKALAIKYVSRKKPIKLIWCAGKQSKKSKNLIAYCMVNAGLASHVDALNDHYKNAFEAYYLPTGLISPSTKGDEYIHQMGPELKNIAEHPRVIANTIKNVLESKIPVGMIHTTKKIL